MQDKFNSVNIYEIKASVNDRQIDETFFIGGRNINDAIKTAEEYIKEMYDDYGCSDIEILTIGIARKKVIINKDEI